MSLLELLYLMIYIFVLVAVVVLYRRIEAENGETRDLRDIFSRDLEVVSLASKLKIALVQYRLFILKPLSIIFISVLILSSLPILSWNSSPAIEVAQYTTRESFNNSILILDSSSGVSEVITNITPILYVYRLDLEVPIVIRTANIFLRVDEVLLLNCTNSKILPIIDQMCEKDLILLGREVPSEIHLYYKDHVYTTRIFSYDSLSDDFIVPNVYSLRDLFDFRQFTLLGLRVTPKIELIINLNSSLAELFKEEISNLTPIKIISVLPQNTLLTRVSEVRGYIEYLKDYIIENNINQLIIYSDQRIYILYPNVLYSFILSVVVSSMYGLLFGLNMILFVKAYRESYLKYSISSMISGGTDWIARVSLLTTLALYGLTLDMLSIAISSAIYLTLFRETMSLLSVTILFFGGLLGVVIALVYLWRFLSEESIYHVEKIPSRVFVEYELQVGDLERINSFIIKKLDSSEFFKVIEIHRSVSRESYNILARVIYTYTIGIGADIYIQLYRLGVEKAKISIDIDPWSAEDVPRESLESISRLLISLIEGSIISLA
ncbi:MAG: hypothetical protein ABWJ42_02510 [Sulfolobales archaeon]